VQIRVNWSFREESSSASQKAACGDLNFSGLSPLFRLGGTSPPGTPSELGLLAYLFLATASHGLLDAITNGGLGVAFFSPFDNTRYFLPWRPIRVSPIAVTRFFTPQEFAILQTEMLWIWLPAMLFAGLIWMLRRKSQSHVTIPSE
jgi:hypothetical protein